MSSVEAPSTTAVGGVRAATRPAPAGSGEVPRAPAPAFGPGRVLAPVAALLGGGRWLVHRPARLVVATLAVGCFPSGPGGGSYTFGDVLSLGLVLVLALDFVRGRVRLPVPAAAVFGAVVVATGLAVITSQDTATSLLGLVRFLQLFVLVPLAVAVAVRDRQDVLLVARGLVAVALAEGAVGTYQYLTHTGALYQGANVRAIGTFGATDIMAMSTLVSYGFLCALGLALASRSRARVLYAAITIVLLLPLGVSYSRGAWIAVAVGGLVVLLLAARRILLGVVLVAAVGSAVAAVASGPDAGLATRASLGDRLSSITEVAGDHPDQSVLDRYGLWSASVRMWAEHPLTGVGLKNFASFRDSNAPLSLSASSDIDEPGSGYQRQPLLSSHSLYLLVLAEAGALGGLAVFGLLATLLVRTLSRTRHALGTPWAWAGIAATGLITWQLTSFVYGDIGGPSTVFIAVVLGLVTWWAFWAPLPATAPAAGPSPPSEPAPRAPKGAGATAPVLVALRRRPRTVTASLFDRHLPARTARSPARRPTLVTLRPRPRPPGMDGADPEDRGEPEEAEEPEDPESEGARGDPRMEPSRRFVVRATVLSMLLVAVGSLCGLGRDLLVAGLFGANGETDAYLLGWTVSETAAPLLIEGAMAFVMVPAFSRALAARNPHREVRDVLEDTLPFLALLLAAVSAGVAVCAPVLVRILAPGLENPVLAAQCMRVAAVSVLLMGVAGYLSAALRAHGVFGPPAAVTVAFNVGIIGCTLAFHQQLGVVAAAIGIAVGCVLMVLIQLPWAVTRLRAPRRLRAGGVHVSLWMFMPVAIYTLARQSQVFVERFLGSSLPPGTVSQLNYAQKIGQTPTVLSLLVVTVTFPMLARSIASGRHERARMRLESDLRVITGFVLVASIFLIAFAEPLVTLLLERGRFSADDGAATAAILRVYSIGLIGQAVVDVMCRSYFSTARPSWFPAGAMGVGVLLTVVAGVLAAQRWGASGIAAANAAGILLAAGVLLARSNLWPRWEGLGLMARALRVLAAPVVAAGLAAWALRTVLDGTAPWIAAVVGGLGVALAFVTVVAIARPVGARFRRGVEDPAVVGSIAPPRGRHE